MKSVTSLMIPTAMGQNSQAECIPDAEELKDTVPNNSK